MVGRRRRKTIPVDVRLRIAAKSAGRCSFRGCNRRLDEHQLTKAKGKFSAFAHIVAAKPDGPRGDRKLSPKLETEESNIMLVCADCHRLIDVEGRDQYDADSLREMKREHEDRVARVTGFGVERRTKVVVVCSRIGDRPPLASVEDAERALLDDEPPRYSDGAPVVVKLEGREQWDHEHEYWPELAREVERKLDRGLDAPGALDHVSLFAIAPIPLLMHVGRVVGDLRQVDVRARFRADAPWNWPDERDPPQLDVVRPRVEADSDHVAVVVSLSQLAPSLTSDGPLSDVPEYRISARTPAVDCLTSAAQIRTFGQHFRALLTEIRDFHGPETTVHVGAAVPNAAAVEMGRILLPKADCALVAYDFNWKTNGWQRALDILPVR